MKIGGTTALEFHRSGSCPAWIAKVPKCGKDFPIPFEVNSSAIFKGLGKDSHRVPRCQTLSSLITLVVERKTMGAAGHVTTCDTNFSTGG